MSRDPYDVKERIAETLENIEERLAALVAIGRGKAVGYPELIENSKRSDNEIVKSSLA